MHKHILTILLILLGFYSASFAQNDLVKLAKNANWQALRDYVKNVSSNNSKINTLPLIQYIEAQPDSSQVACIDSLSLFFIYTIRRVELNLNISFYLSLQQLIETYRKAALTRKDYNLWGLSTIFLSDNAYYLNNTTHAGKYYEELFEYWDNFDIILKYKAARKSGNHFMGVAQDYDKAYNYYTKIESIPDLDNRKLSYYYQIMTELFLRKNDVARADEYAAKLIAQNGTDLNDNVYQLILLGKVNLAKNELVSANFFLEKALKKLNQKDQSLYYYNNFYCRTVANLLQIAILQKDNIKAQQYAKMLSDINNENDGQATAIRHQNLLSYYLYANDRNAFEALNNQLKYSRYINHVVYAPSLKIIAESWLKQGNFVLALTYCNKTLNLLKNTHSKASQNLYNRNLPLALNTLSLKLDLFGRINLESPSHFVSLNDSIYNTAQEAIQLIDQMRKGLSTEQAKLDLLQITPKVYESALEILSKKYLSTPKEVYLTEMFTLIERSKAILLSDALQESKAKNFGKVPAEMSRREKVIYTDLRLYEVLLDNAMRQQDSSAIIRYKAKVFDKRNELNQLKKNLEINYPKYYAYKYRNTLTDYNLFKTRLDNISAKFINYFVGKNNLYILSVSSNSIQLRTEKTYNNKIIDLNTRLPDLRSLISNPEQVLSSNYLKKITLFKLCRQFYQLLLRTELNSNDFERLIISPDGPLHYIPYGILLTDESTDSSLAFKQWPFLIKKYPISYNYNAKLWLSCSEDKSSSQEIRILGMAAKYDIKTKTIEKNELVNLQGLLPLLGADKEIELLQQKYKGTFVRGAAATEQKFKREAPKHDILHLALHGLMNNENPMLSCLVFSESNDPQIDNNLHNFELMSMDLQANLVVLSACSTGDGKYLRGEGVMSLARGFMYAGSSSLLSTLWPINDNSSQQVMQLFYKNLFNGMDKDIALQQAKLDFIGKNNDLITHPFFWGAYVLMGDTTAIKVCKKSNFWLLAPLVFIVMIMLFIFKKNNILFSSEQ